MNAKILNILQHSNIEIYNSDKEVYPSVFYIGLGKTASQSICSSFLDKKVAHWHNEQYFQRIYNISLEQLSLLDIVDKVSGYAVDKPLIVECCREPIARSLSVLFQEFYMNRIDPKQSLNYDFIIFWLKKYLSRHIQPYSIKWKAQYNIDIFNEGLLIKNKYAFYDINKTKLLFLRYENLEEAELLLKSFGYRFKLQQKNQTKDRLGLKNTYHYLKQNIKFDKHFLNQIYNEHWIQATYSLNEINTFIEKYAL